MLRAAAALGALVGSARAADRPARIDPRFEGLVTQKGRPVDEAAFKGRFRLVFFGYTHCLDVCPMTLYAMKRVLEALGPDASRLRVVYVTIDPARDTPQALDEMIGHFDQRIVGLTGTPGAIAKVARNYGVTYFRDVQVSPGEYYMVHTTHSVLIDPDGYVRDLFEVNDDPDAMAHDVASRIRSAFGRGGG